MTSDFTIEEVRLASRNKGMPLEGLRYDVTPSGMHYLLIHFDIPHAEASTYQLRVDGRVQQPLLLSLEDIKARPAVTTPVTLECAGNGRAHIQPRVVSQPWTEDAVGTYEWTGTPLAPILEEAGVSSDAVEVVFSGMDVGEQGGVEHAYERSLTLEEVRRSEVFLAYEANGSPLLPQHGYPLRLIVPGWYGMASVKWLQSITVVNTPFQGYQQAVAYRVAHSEDDPGEPVTRMFPRSLMIPPGLPEFLTRQRILPPGRHILQGRAWSGWAPVKRVEVSVDGGANWAEAVLGAPVGPHAWRDWSLSWEAMEGCHQLMCRASDAAGNTQPLETSWNMHGMVNNSVHQVDVEVR